MSNIDQVRTAKARYCRYVDTKQWDAFKALLLPNPELRFYNVAGELLYSFDNREAFVAVSRDFLANSHSIHQIHNEELTQVSATEIHAIWSMEDYIVNSDGSDRHHGFGHYHETWVLSDEDWRLAALELRRTIVKAAQ